MEGKRMIFVLEIEGRAVLAFEADNLDDARAYAADAGELEDLEELTSNGKPLWNGEDEIGVRAATDDEADIFEEQREEDWEDEPHADAEDFVVYLVPLDEPEDED
jgi:hypothetical protein